MTSTAITPALIDINGPVPVEKYPTRLDVRCRACRHAGTALLYLCDVHKLKCSACGCADVSVAGRETVRARAIRRRKQKLRPRLARGVRP